MSKMKKLILCLMLISMGSVAAVTPNHVYAKQGTTQQEKKENVVYATKRGKKYHREGCPFIKNSKTIITENEP